MLHIITSRLISTYYYFKADILAGKITYSTDKSFLANECTISARRAFEVIGMNRNGEKPEKLDGGESIRDERKSKDLLEQESLTRFDKNKNSKNKKKKNKNSQQTPGEAEQPVTEKQNAQNNQNRQQKGQQQQKQQQKPQQEQPNAEQEKQNDNRPKNQRNKYKGNQNKRQQNGNQGQQGPRPNNQQRPVEGKVNENNLPQ